MEITSEQDDDLQLSITFDELRCFDVEDVATCVSVKSALQICQRSLDELSIKAIEVLSLWLRKLLRGYLCESECFIEVFKCLYDWLLKLKGDVNPNNKFACCDFIMLLTDAISFANWAKDKLLKAGDRIVHTTSFFLLAIVYSYLQLSNENNAQDLQEHEPMAIELHLIILHMLKEISLSTTRAHDRITSLLRQLVEIADFLNFNLSYRKALVKTSKTMTIICVHYNSVDKSLARYQAMPNWLQETALHLCDMVLNQLEQICQQHSASPEENLKLMAAYLIMFHKLLGSGIKHVSESVLETLALLMQRVAQIIPINNAVSDLSKLIVKHVQPYFIEIYEVLYQLRAFQKHLMTILSESKHSTEDYYELCLYFVIISSIEETELTQFTIQTVQEIFDYLSGEVGNFCNADRYKRLLEAFASFLHVSGSSECFNYFCAGVFQEDIIRSQMCADILMLCFRLQELETGWSKSAIEQAKDFWNKCNNSYVMFSLNPSQWHTQRMLKYFHGLGRTNELTQFNLHNYRYMLCVANEMKLQQRLLLLRLHRLFNDQIQNVVQYYEVVALMELMNPNTTEFSTQLLDSIKEMLVKEPFKRLANTYFKLALNFSSDTKLRILQIVMPTNAMASTCWHVARFLHDCQNSEDAQLKSLAEQHTLAPFHTLLQTLYPGVTDLELNSDEHDMNYAKLEYHIAEKHQCKKVNLKRKYSEGNEGTEILKQLEQNTQKLIACAADLDEIDLQQLKSIVTNVKNILLKQQR